ncbi:MAG TPA: ankyrin repeat domain-containing protein [Planktothrix sp.]|jgi:ankyrin repeat protein
MSTPSKTIIKEFIDAVINDRDTAEIMLADRPALLNAKYLRGDTLLHHLAVNGNVDAVKFLLERGARVDDRNETNCTALMEVAVLGSEEMTRLLLAHGADPNLSTATFDTPLVNAVRAGRIKMVELLLASGADPSARSVVGCGIFDCLPERSDLRLAIYKVIEKYAPAMPNDSVSG